MGTKYDQVSSRTLEPMDDEFRPQIINGELLQTDQTTTHGPPEDPWMTIHVIHGVFLTPPSKAVPRRRVEKRREIKYISSLSQVITEPDKWRGCWSATAMTLVSNIRPSRDDSRDDSGHSSWVLGAFREGPRASGESPRVISGDVSGVVSRGANIRNQLFRAAGPATGSTRNYCSLRTSSYTGPDSPYTLP